MQTNSAVEQNKIIRWSESPWNQSGRKRKGLRRRGSSSWQFKCHRCVEATYHTSGL